VIALRLDAARHLQIQEQVAATIAMHQRAKRSEPPGAVHDLRHADLVQAAIQPLEMGVQAIGATVVDRQHFVHRVAEQESTVERRDSRLDEREQAAIEPDER